MCLIAFAWNAHPRLPLVIVANRDEFHQRPTAALAEWEGVPGVIGGRDLREGGGWLALNHARGRLAAVTNVREPSLTAAARSRGGLVRDFVAGEDCAVAFAEQVRVNGNEYSGFNFIAWDREELVYATNRLKPRWETLQRGVHGLSNGALDKPWPKTRCLSAALSDWLTSVPTGTTPAMADLDLSALFTALADEKRAPDAELPDTGVGIEHERFVAPAFIRGQQYGTRASSVVLIGSNGCSLFVERCFGPDGVDLGTRQLELRLGLESSSVVKPAAVPRPPE